MKESGHTRSIIGASSSADSRDGTGGRVRLAGEAVKADPQSVDFLNTLGAILYRAGRSEEAIEWLSRANKLIEDADRESKSPPAYIW